MTLLLALALLGQADPASGILPGAIPSTIHAPLTPETKDALLALGSRDAPARRTAYRAIWRLPEPERTRAIIRGGHAKDAEIRGSCRAMWNTLYVCSHCHNTRTCPIWKDYDNTECPIDHWSGQCRVCLKDQP